MTNFGSVRNLRIPETTGGLPMMRMLLASCVLALFLAGSATAGVIYEIEVKDYRSNATQAPESTEVSAVSVEGKLLKMEIQADPDAPTPHQGRSSATAKAGNGTSAGLAAGSSVGSNVSGGDMLFNGHRREMKVVDHRDGSYMVIDMNAIKQIAGQTNNAMSQLGEALKNVPDDKRAMIAEMMKQRMPQAAAAPKRSTSELRGTGETGTKNGYQAVKYEVWQDGRKRREMWVTDWSSIEGGAQAREAFNSLAEFFKELKDAIPKFGESNKNASFEHMKELGGFPVLTREFNRGGELESENALRSARRATLNPEDFEPPAGYKRQAMPGVR
ncbi:MAG: hypothetical protein H6993_14125 [Pseudomonadales bacterium]|nr:hypothetical protein [Pseudomonadales bacterium]MCP5185097.1 hypothetical protein [Pseudomonadales bacterium]